MKENRETERPMKNKNNNRTKTETERRPEHNFIISSELQKWKRVERKQMEIKWEQNDRKPEGAWNRNSRTTNLLCHLWFIPLFCRRQTKRLDSGQRTRRNRDAVEAKTGDILCIDDKCRCSRYLIKNNIFYLCACSTGFVKPILLTQKTVVSLCMIMFISKFLKT